jgi:hypothetical protein
MESEGGQCHDLECTPIIVSIIQSGAPDVQGTVQATYLLLIYKCGA